MNLQHYNFNDIHIYVLCKKIYIWTTYFMYMDPLNQLIRTASRVVPGVSAGSDWMQFFFNVLYNQVANFLTEWSPGDHLPGIYPNEPAVLIFIFGPLGGPKKAPGWPFLCFFFFFVKPPGGLLLKKNGKILPSILPTCYLKAGKYRRKKSPPLT